MKHDDPEAYLDNQGDDLGPIGTVVVVLLVIWGLASFSSLNTPEKAAQGFDPLIHCKPVTSALKNTMGIQGAKEWCRENY